MYEEVGVAPDRRREVGVAPQGEPEMADIVGAVGRLGLAPKDEVIDERGFRRSGGAAQYTVEELRFWRLSLRER